MTSIQYFRFLISNQDADAHVVQLKFIGDTRSTRTHNYDNILELIELNSKDVVHHMLLHLCENFDTVDGMRSIPTIYASPDICVGRNHPTPLGYPGCTVLYTWARGGRPMNLPHEAGFRIKSTNKSSYYFVLDMHYNNPEKVIYGKRKEIFVSLLMLRIHSLAACLTLVA